MKRILMIGTGGTIASEMTDAGLSPGLRGADFLQYTPGVENLCHVDCLQVCNIDSTNMTPGALHHPGRGGSDPPLNSKGE